MNGLFSGLLRPVIQASSNPIIGGADGQAAIFVTAKKAGDIGDAVVLGLQGMAGIFSVMIVIAIIVWALPKLSVLFDRAGGSRKEDNDDAEDDK